MGDAGAFEDFYLSCRDRLVTHVAALTGDPAEAADHVQEGFLRAWERWERISRYEDPEGWVRRVSYHRAIGRWRRARRLVRWPGAAGGGIQWDSDQLAVIDGLRALPRREREAIVLHHVVGLSVREVAAEMGVPEGTVKSWLSRGRARLGAALAAAEPQEA